MKSYSSISIIASIAFVVLFTTTTTTSFVLPNYNHGMVKRIIDNTNRSYNSKHYQQQQKLKEDQDDMVLSSSSKSLLCNNAYGYCSTWG